MKTANIDDLVEKGLILSEDKRYIKGCKSGDLLEGVICIPNSIKGFDLNYGSYEFSGCNKITHIILPPGFEGIGRGSFSRCSSLVSINIPDSVTCIRAFAFDGCISLQYIRIPKSTIEIDRPFSTNIYIEVSEENPQYHSVKGSLYDIRKKKLIKYYCGVLENEVKVEESTEIIEDYAFGGCTNLRTAILSDSITKIGRGIFSDCKNLQFACFPSTITEIPAYAFAGCSILENFTVGENVKKIESGSFRNCISLERIVIPSSVISIGDNAFSGCTGLREVVIEGNPTIEQNAFSRCESIEIFSAENKKNIDETFLFTHLSDSKAVVKLVLNGVTINASDIFRKSETEFKSMSMFYNGWGMNITKIRGNGLREVSFKDLDEKWNHSLDDFYDEEQSKGMVLAENWYRNSGIGLVLGWNNYHAINVDWIIKEIDIKNIIEQILELLGLPQNYPWVVKSGSGCGFHIIFRCEELKEKFYTKKYDAVDVTTTGLFHDLELRWKAHLVMPPSIHFSGQRYEFYNGIPNSIPEMIEIGAIDNLIIHYCGSFEIGNFRCRNKNLRLVNWRKSYYSRLLVEDSVEWLEKAKTPEAFNSLALLSLLNEKQSDFNYFSNIEKAEELFGKSNSDFSNFNMASLIAGGFLNGSIDDVEYYLSKIKDTSFFSFTSRKGLFIDMFAEVRNNAKDLLSKDECILLFFDTETTGLPQNYETKSSDTDNWPRLVQLSWILTTSKGKILNKGNYIVKPQGFIIPKSAYNIHGISTEYANTHGTDLQEVLDNFIVDLVRAEKIIGHNINYDKKVIGAEMYRMEDSGMAEIMDSKETICTMQSSVDFCRIPGYKGYKYPTLQELYKKLFNKEMVNAHNAMCDIEATKRCFWEMKKRKIIK